MINLLVKLVLALKKVLMDLAGVSHAQTGMREVLQLVGEHVRSNQNSGTLLSGEFSGVWHLCTKHCVAIGTPRAITITV